MNIKNIIIAVLAVIFIPLAVFMLYSAGIHKRPLSSYINPEVSPKYSSFDSCSNNSDCRMSGCSNEYCQGVNSDKAGSVCQIREDYPNMTKFRCGCFQEKCQWGRKSD